MQADQSLGREFYELATLRYFSDSETIILPETHQDYVFVLENGLIRSYFRDDLDLEITTWFYQNGDLLLTDNFRNRIESRVIFQACGTCRLYQIKMKDYQRIKENSAEFSRIAANLEKAYSEKMFGYVYHLLRLPDNKRYQTFLQMYPGILCHAKGKHIASFLNVHPNTLSRMKRKLPRD